MVDNQNTTKRTSDDYQGESYRDLSRGGLFELLFDQGIHLVHGLKVNMKNRLMPMWDKIMLREWYIIECVNEQLKNKANIMHSRHCSVHNFIMNICLALTAYCFFDNKPEALPVHVENTMQLTLFFERKLSRARVFLLLCLSQ